MKKVVEGAKAFDTVTHKLLIANLNAYVFLHDSLSAFCIPIFLTDGKEQKFTILSALDLRYY